jgi:acyl carrier protein
MTDLNVHPTPSPTEIQQQLANIITKELQWELRSVDKLREDLDSIKRWEFIVAVEDHFQIAFDAEDESQLETLEDLVVMIGNKLAHTPS